jgi:hypothetical protein
MNKVQEIETKIAGLSAQELAEFREWFHRFDAETWDRQFEVDAKSGKLDRLAKEAQRDHAAGKSTKL